MNLTPTMKDLCIWCSLSKPCPCTTNTPAVLNMALEAASATVIIDNMEGENGQTK